MELDREILKTALKGINDLEGDIKESFEIKGLSVGEASFLQTYYLFNYFIKMDKENRNSSYKLIVSKMEMNKRGKLN